MSSFKRRLAALACLAAAMGFTMVGCKSEDSPSTSNGTPVMQTAEA